MKPKQLAAKLQISDVEILRIAIQLKMTGVGFKTQLSDAQVQLIEEQYLRNSTHQLNAATEIPEPINQDTESVIEQVSEAPLEESESAIKQVSEAPLGKNEKGIAEIRQTTLSNAMAASENQQAHILEVEMQQAADDGLRVGAVKELVRATKEFEGVMLVRDAVFQKKQASRDRLNELLKDSADDDFLSTSQLSSQTYTQTAGTGAATMMDVHQALKNLGVNL